MIKHYCLFERKRKGWQAIFLFVNKLVMILSKLNRFNAKKTTTYNSNIEGYFYRGGVNTSKVLGEFEE